MDSKIQTTSHHITQTAELFSVKFWQIKNHAIELAFQMVLLFIAYGLKTQK